MMDYTNFFTLYLANMGSDEYLRIAELKRKERSALNRNKPAFLTLILEGAGNALISTGNRLLKIA